MNAAQLQSRLSQAAKEIASPRAAMEKVSLIVHGRSMKKSPVDTGTLRRSLSRKVTPTTAHEGSNLEYARPVHEGTKFMEGRPFIYEAIQESVADIERVLQDFGNAVFRKVGG